MSIGYFRLCGASARLCVAPWRRDAIRWLRFHRVPGGLSPRQGSLDCFSSGMMGRTDPTSELRCSISTVDINVNSNPVCPAGVLDSRTPGNPRGGRGPPGSETSRQIPGSSAEVTPIPPRRILAVAVANNCALSGHRSIPHAIAQCMHHLASSHPARSRLTFESAVCYSRNNPACAIRGHGGQYELERDTARDRVQHVASQHRTPSAAARRRSGQRHSTQQANRAGTCRELS